MDKGVGAHARAQIPARFSILQGETRSGMRRGGVWLSAAWRKRKLGESPWGVRVSIDGVVEDGAAGCK